MKSLDNQLMGLSTKAVEKCDNGCKIVVARRPDTNAVTVQFEEKAGLDFMELVFVKRCAEMRAGASPDRLTDKKYIHNDAYPGLPSAAQMKRHGSNPIRGWKATDRVQRDMRYAITHNFK